MFALFLSTQDGIKRADYREIFLTSRMLYADQARYHIFSMGVDFKVLIIRSDKNTHLQAKQTTFSKNFTENQYFDQIWGIGELSSESL